MMLGQLVNHLERKILDYHSILFFFSILFLKLIPGGLMKKKFIILGVRKVFLSMTTKTEIIKEKGDRIDYVKI